MGSLIAEPLMMNENQAIVFVEVPLGFIIESIDTERDHFGTDFVKVSMRREKDAF